MQTITWSATKARNEFFDLLNLVASGNSVFIKKDSVVVANVTPIIAVSRNKGLVKALEKASKGFTYSVKDNPLRKKGSTDFLGKWDL